MNGKDNPKVIDRESLVKKLREIRDLSLAMTRGDIPQVRNNMELVLSLVNELLFLLDNEYQRP